MAFGPDFSTVTAGCKTRAFYGIFNLAEFYCYHLPIIIYYYYYYYCCCCWYFCYYYR